MKQRRTRWALGMGFLVLIVSSACLWPAVSASSELSSEVTQTWEALSNFSSQASQEPPAVQEESQEEQIVPSDTPGPPMMHVTVDTNCRSGPGILYDYLGALLTGELAEVLARGSEPGFWVIENPDNLGTECWVGEQYAVIEGDTSVLSERAAPPTPTQEESAPSLGSIAGFVYRDGNNNGHFGDPEDSPWMYAVVRLMEGDCPGGPIITTLTTNTSGGYMFSDVPAGLYCVATTNSIFLPGHYEIDLTEGQHLVGINFRSLP